MTSVSPRPPAGASMIFALTVTESLAAPATSETFTAAVAVSTV